MAAQQNLVTLTIAYQKHEIDTKGKISQGSRVKSLYILHKGTLKN